MFHKTIQAFAAMFYMYAAMFCGMMAFFVLNYLLFTDYYWITLAYLVWLKIDGKTEEQVLKEGYSMNGAKFS